MTFSKASIRNLQIMTALIPNLQQTCMIFLTAADHTNDQEVVDKQAQSLLSTTASILNTESINATMQDSPIHVSICQ
jgi:hypothetical protein